MVFLECILNYLWLLSLINSFSHLLFMRWSCFHGTIHKQWINFIWLCSLLAGHSNMLYLNPLMNLYIKKVFGFVFKIYTKQGFVFCFLITSFTLVLFFQLRHSLTLQPRLILNLRLSFYLNLLSPGFRQYGSWHQAKGRSLKKSFWRGMYWCRENCVVDCQGLRLLVASSFEGCCIMGNLKEL